MATGLRSYSAPEAQNAALGALGSDRITDTATHTAGAGDYTAVRRWSSFKAETATVFGTGCEVEDDMGDAPANGETLAAGDTWFGPLTVIVLSSGSGRAYRG